jgi:hypothetical protein
MDEGQVKRVHSLAQLDRDAVSVYDEALKHVDDPDVKAHFIEFRDEHAHHVAKLSEAVVRLGGPEPELKVDLMGTVADWVTAFRSILGEKGPLHALHSAESYHNSRYKEAASWDLGDSDLSAELQTFYAEEQRHLGYVDDRLAAKASSAH